MYNRYIPQADGSYRRTRIQDPVKSQKPRSTPCPEPVVNPPKPVYESPTPRPHHHSANDTSITGFLHKLLPKDFDTGDLLVILLLLLISADCVEDQNTALLTLAIYFFM